MRTEVVPRMREIECYVCGSPDVTTLCHHCRRAMCDLHGPAQPPEDRWFYQIKSTEFTELGMTDVDENEMGAHCEQCNHYTISYKPLITAISIAVSTIAIIVGLLVPSLASTLLGILLALTLIFAGRWVILVERQHRHYQERASRPPLPIIGRSLSVAVEESIHGRVILDSNGEYKVQETEAQGYLFSSLVFANHDRERLEKYRQKYGLGMDSDVRFHAGFVVLQGKREYYLNSHDSQLVNPTVLIGRVIDQAFLNRSDTILNRRWSRPYRYFFALDTQHTAGLPVQIIPTLISEEEEWAIELIVQTNPKVDTSSLVEPRVKKLTLVVPTELGEAESNSPFAKGSEVRQDEQGEWRQIVWTNVDVDQGADNPYASFYVRFANSMEVEPEVRVKGQLQLTLGGTLSGLENVAVFSPLGFKSNRRRTAFTKHTNVRLDFVFDLGGLRLRKLVSRTKPVDNLITIPGNETITRLVKALSDNDIYVQQVIENPPSTNWANARIKNRFWVISGRRYERINPVDFRIVAVGYEQYEDTDKPHDGTTRFELTTQGTVIEECMETALESLQEDIVNIIQTAPSFELLGLTTDGLRAGKLGTLSGFIKNAGKVLAKEISISAMGPSLKVWRTSNVKKLESGASELFELTVVIEKDGVVPVVIIVNCEDEFGQLPPYKWSYAITVEEKPSPPSVGSQTYYYGPVTGPAHSGIGNINQVTDDKPNEEQ